MFKRGSSSHGSYYVVDSSSPSEVSSTSPPPRTRRSTSPDAYIPSPSIKRSIAKNGPFIAKKKVRNSSVVHGRPGGGRSNAAGGGRSLEAQVEEDQVDVKPKIEEAEADDGRNFSSEFLGMSEQQQRRLVELVATAAQTGREMDWAAHCDEFGQAPGGLQAMYELLSNKLCAKDYYNALLPIDLTFDSDDGDEHTHADESPTGHILNNNHQFDRDSTPDVIIVPSVVAEAPLASIPRQAKQDAKDKIATHQSRADELYEMHRVDERDEILSDDEEHKPATVSSNEGKRARVGRGSASKGRWADEEEGLLLATYCDQWEQNREIDWDAITRVVKKRTGSACYTYLKTYFKKEVAEHKKKFPPLPKHKRALANAHATGRAIFASRVAATASTSTSST